MIIYIYILNLKYWKKKHIKKDYFRNQINTLCDESIKELDSSINIIQ